MRSSAFLIAAFAATALSGPVQLKRAVVTEWEYKTVTEIVYVNGPAPTPVAEQHDTPKEHQHGHSVQHSQGPPDFKETPSVEVVPAPHPPSESPAPEPAPEATTEAAPAPTLEPMTEAPAPAPTPEPTPEAPAPAPSSAAPESSSSPAPSTDQSHYQDLVLFHHNVHRANHSASDLVWNQTLADAAAAYAPKCQFKHFVEGYGQNLAASAPDANVTAQISEGWYNSEVGFYNGLYSDGTAGYNPSMDNFHAWGHFSQMVWKDTKSVGCTTYDCRNTQPSGENPIQMWYTICNYFPAGNMGGAYGINVGEPLGHATSHWNNKL